MSNWIDDELSRLNKNLLRTNVIILVLILLVAVAQSRYLLNFVRGCEQIDASELARLVAANERARNFVTVTGSKSIKSGYRDVERKVRKSTGEVISTEIKAEYVLLKVADKLLLVKAKPGAELLEYSGALVPTSDSLQSGFVQQLRAREPELAKDLLPFTLDAADYLDLGYGLFAIGIPLLLLALWNCWKVMQRSRDRRAHPLVRQLGLYGNVDQISMQIQTERNQPRTKWGDLEVTQSWLIRQKSFSTWVSPIRDVAWAYKKITRHSVNFIPTGKTYSVIILGRHKQRIEINLKEEFTTQLLTILATRVPWAIFGFSSELEKAWRKDPAGFVKSVDLRCQQFAAKASTATNS